MALVDDLLKANYPRAVLVVITASDETYYLSNRPYRTTSADTPADVTFNPIISTDSAPRIKHALGTYFSTRSFVSNGTIKLTRWTYLKTSGNTVTEIDITTKELRAATIEIKVAGPREQYTYASALTMFTGVVSSFKYKSSGEVEIGFKSRDILSTRYFPTDRYATGEADDSVLGTIKPFLRGQVDGARPILIDAANLRYELCVNEVTAGSSPKIYVYDKGVLLKQDVSVVAGTSNSIGFAYGETSSVSGYYNSVWVRNRSQWRKVSSYTGGTHTATVSSNWTDNPQAGDTCEVYLYREYCTVAGARFELLSSPLGTVSANVSGDTTNNVGQEAAFMLTTYGGLTGFDIVNNIPTTYDVYPRNDLPAFQLVEPVSIADFLDKLMIPAGCTWYVARDGRIVLQQIAYYPGGHYFPPPWDVLKFYDNLDEVTVEHADAIYRFNIKYAIKNIVVNDLADGVPDSLRDDFARPYLVYTDGDDAPSAQYPWTKEFSLEAPYHYSSAYVGTYIGLYVLGMLALPRSIVTTKLPHKYSKYFLTSVIGVSRRTDENDSLAGMIISLDEVLDDYPSMTVRLLT